MKFKLITLRYSIFLACIFSSNIVRSQFLMDMIDTTKDIGKSLLSVSKKFDRIRIGGYIQAQYQVAGSKGISSFNGGDFAANSNNRFMLRRGRIRFEYAHFPEGRGSSVQFVFQFDGTERGVVIRDFYGRMLENRFKLFTLSAGMFARPFSYELNLSSSDRESPERGRMSQILMKTERDLGAMFTIEAREKKHTLKYFKLDFGLFNGQGLNATTDFDSHKDFISRVALKPYPLNKNLTLSAGASLLQGGLLQNTRYVYTIKSGSAGKFFSVDSALKNNGRIAPRNYYGADVQIKLKTKPGYSEIRAEFMTGTQTALANTSETPAALPTDPLAGFYERQFTGGYFYFLHNFISPKHQLVFKYDWYDPNRKVSGNEIGLNNINSANISYSTIGVGYVHYFSESIKTIFYYDRVINETTSLPAFATDIKDDVFTARLQFRF